LINSRGHVFIIGAGPGDPGLVSARGVRLLSEADVVVYDRAAEAALRWARPDAERIEAGAPAERNRAGCAVDAVAERRATVTSSRV
jgi:siroheme synthase